MPRNFRSGEAHGFICRHCIGEGYLLVPGTRFVRCTDCDGTGSVIHDEGCECLRCEEREMLEDWQVQHALRGAAAANAAHADS